MTPHAEKFLCQYIVSILGTDHPIMKDWKLHPYKGGACYDKCRTMKPLKGTLCRSGDNDIPGATVVREIEDYLWLRRHKNKVYRKKSSVREIIAHAHALAADHDLMFFNK